MGQLHVETWKYKHLVYPSCHSCHIMEGVDEIFNVCVIII
jgi:hypothetical protein